ncbi:major facilitator superfamily domain-containing protein [Piptocephalis cylindrospora]|uniref:Major facilitator superfamily domain-containing protein n=1 Tax=Piptocephalis cylindrospora TaxID=1907219 RepID=A0A4V1IY32_9FUNG|nr:major facilitator superfamily domain-containing protein [Piptocephalis cylindrospora]|eukprot:RKP13149.1 major facilitator superfamily domain-containing protein [Piptocephalis cylindrospora]
MQTAVEKNSPTIDIYPPDHPKGWWMMFFVFCINFSLSGCLLSWGLYQRAYLEGDYRNEKSSTVTLIGGTCAALVYGLGIVFGKLIQIYGIRWPLIIGTILYPVGLVLASFSTSIWHLFLTQSLIPGIGCSLVLFSASHLPSQWFDRRRGLASGIAVSGTSVGAATILQITQVMINRWGVRWALRVSALIYLALLLLPCIFLQERIRCCPTSEEETIERSKESRRRRIARIMRELIDLSLLLNPKVALLAVSATIYIISYTSPYYFLPSYATFIGLPDEMGAIATMVLTLSSGVGRIVAGWLADRYGSINILFITLTLSGVVTLLIWPFATSLALLMVFAILFGLFQASFMSLVPVITASLVPLHEAASAIGVVMGIQFPGDIVGPAVFGALVDATAPNTSYLPAELFNGACCIIASLLLLPLRWMITRTFWTKV